MKIVRVVAAAMVLLVARQTAAHVVPGQVAPRYTVSTFDKQKITSDQLKGQVVIINLWATWCGPCKRELPAIDAFYREHAKEGLRVFAVTTDESTPDYMLNPISHLLAFPLAHRIPGSAFDTLGGVPTSYVIDRAGVIRYAKAAAFDQASLDEVIGPLLAQPAPAPAPAAPAP